MLHWDYTTTAEAAAETLQEEIRGRNVVITGVSPVSLGAETVRVLAPYAATIIIASRTQSKVEEVIRTVRQEIPNFSPHFVHLDLSSLTSVRRAARTINNLGLPIHVLINNAAAPISPTLQRTSEGFESQFGANVLGHFLFTALLLPSLLPSTPSPSYPSSPSPSFSPTAFSPGPPARVIQITSTAEGITGPRFHDPNYDIHPEEYDGWEAYGASKSANVLFARELARRFGDVGVVGFSVHPGAIRNTGLGGVASDEELMAWGMLNPDGSYDPSVIKSLETGCATQIIAAFDPYIGRQSGGYLQNGVVRNDQLSEWSTSAENGWKLWQLCENLVEHHFEPVSEGDARILSYH